MYSNDLQVNVSNEDGKPPQAKMKIDLAPADWHRKSVERVWVDLLEDGTVRVSNIPFYAYGLSFGDRVKVDFRDGELCFDEVVESSGHRTYRIIVPRKFDAAAEAAFEQRWAPLAALGCTYEGAGPPVNLFAVDVPPEVDFRAAESLLRAGEADNTWDFERSNPEFLPDEPPTAH
jgi:hypothetical protein